MGCVLSTFLCVNNQQSAITTSGAFVVGAIITDLVKLKSMSASATDNLLIDIAEKLSKLLNKVVKQIDKFNKV